jgi:endoglucanase
VILHIFALGVALTAPDSARFIRVNQVGYLPDAPKVAVFCALDSAAVGTFVVRNESGKTVFGPARARATGSFGPCVSTYRLDFSALKKSGLYTIAAGGALSLPVRISPNAYAGAADTLLYYLRQQRSGYNPFFRDSVHKLDGYAIDDTGHVTGFQPVSGGWADASDYLQYVATSATATFDLLMSYRDSRESFRDVFRADGTPGANGVADVLDEARHGIDWLLRMFPDDSTMFNQLADDRDHTYFDLPTSDSSDYGWGKGKQRPVYPCTGRPQGLFKYKNRSTGYASTAGKFAAAFALASQLYEKIEPALSAALRHKAEAAYALGVKYPGICQTAPGRSPYFYEEENWTDDMELAAAELFSLTHSAQYESDALRYAKLEPVTPWMGADTARHYQWYPWRNSGHSEISRNATPENRKLMADYYRKGVEAVIARASNGFRIGVPFIWCSNDLVAAFATQANLYRRMTGDTRFREYEQAAVDWLFGTNPWGVSMVIGYPRAGRWARDPHSAVAARFGAQALTGGLLDGPVYRSIFQNLRGISLHQPDEFAPFNTGFIVYHDDIGDYSTNEPIMDGTANLVYLMASYAPRDATAVQQPDETRVVFIGDSITESWEPYFETFFPGKTYVGRGISGETTAQILARFQRDAVELRPKVVVILGGTNDIAQNGGPVTLEMIEQNLESMADIAREHHIRVVLSSVLPALDYHWRKGLAPAPKIAALNAWMKDYAAKTGAVYLDYYSAMVDSTGGMRAELTLDGVHPNLAGYRVMAPLAEKAIRTSLRNRSTK